VTDGEEQSVESDLGISYFKLVLNDDVDAGKGVNGEGIDERCCEVDYDDNKTIALFWVSCCPLHL
jgi:hypothetical protein